MNLQIKAHLESQGKYTEIAQINQGACAYSFSCHQGSLSRNVFLKIYDFVEGDGVNVFSEPRLFTSAIQSGVRSDNLVDLFDVDVITVAGEKFVCCAMEHINGPSLLTHLEEVCVGQQDAIKITLGILSGLSCLHEKNILHRDIKLANIMLEGMVPKVADLGSAAILQEGANYVKASKNSALYLPPEGFKDPPRYFIQSDLYQVGIVLYELINGPLEQNLLHYFTIKCKKALKDMDKTFDQLDSFEQNKIVNQGIAEHATKGSLLEHGKPPQIYFSKQIKRFIKKLSSPSLTDRFQSCASAAAELSSISLPNWKKVSEEQYFLERWNGYDYRLFVQHKARSKSIVLEKSAAGKNSFQRVNKVQFESLNAAIEYVNGK